MKLGRAIALIITGAFLAACQSAAPLRTVTQGDVLATVDFSRAGTFEEGSYDGATLFIRDGVYRVDVRQGNGELWWGQWGERYGDVIVQVEAVQTTERNENAYGVMCRVSGAVGLPLAGTTEPEPAAATDAPPDEAAEEATEEPADAGEEATAEPTTSAAATPEATAQPVFGDGDGYLFLIQGTGAYGIFVSRGRSLTPLVDWTTSDVVNQGRARNTLSATCVGDYLSFAINGTQVAQVIDSTYRDGQVGLVASAANRLGVRIEFDNLTVFSAGAS
jgi:hypothetical protein